MPFVKSKWPLSFKDNIGRQVVKRKEYGYITYEQSARSTMKIIKTLYLLSAVAFLIMQLVTYQLLPDRVASHFGITMAANCFVAKSQYFKSLLSVFIIMNAVFIALIALFPRTPSGLINTPNRQFWMLPENRPEFDKIFLARLYGLLTAINLIFTVLSYYVFKANMSTPVVLSSHFHIVMIGFLIIVAAGIVQLGVRLRRMH
jgi:uncharacterized membrane protein